MEFEFDPDRSASNLRKHGIDCIDAQALWSAPDMLMVPARTTDEPRILVIGMLNGKHWSAVVTPRGERTRIISVRRSRKQEIAIYEGA